MKKGVLIVVAVVAAAALGFLVQQRLRGGGAVPAESTAATPPASNEAEPAPAEPVAKKIPETIPDFQLADRENKKRRLSDWAGRPLMVNFWATWCAPCRREIPLLNQVRAQRAAQKLEIIGIAVDFRDDVLKYAQETAISYPLLIGEEDGLAAVSAFGMEPNFPFTAFADSKQRLVALKVGELHQEEIDLILDRIVAVDAGKLDLPAARQQISEGLKQIATKRASEPAESPKLPAR
jgi:thiol-disulfide isomerase/thioredoxin